MVRLVAASAVVAVLLAACGSGGTNGASRSTGSTTPGTATTAPSSSTPATSTPATGGTSSTATLGAALGEATSLEGTALATYQAIVGRLGAITPFANVVDSERQHLAAVQAVAARQGVTVPTGSFTAPTPPATKTAACQLGVTTEEHVISTYDRLIPEVAAYPDVAQVLTTLQRAARDSHLPAFQHCA